MDGAFDDGTDHLPRGCGVVVGRTLMALGMADTTWVCTLLRYLNSEVSNPKMLLFSYWFFMQLGWVGSLEHFQTLSWRCPTFQIKVRRCPETHPHV